MWKQRTSRVNESFTQVRTETLSSSTRAVSMVDSLLEAIRNHVDKEDNGVAKCDAIGRNSDDNRTNSK